MKDVTESIGVAYRHMALSGAPHARLARSIYREVNRFSLPAPRFVVMPMQWTYRAVRAVYHFNMRVFVCQPLFASYCKSYGSSLRTGCYVHWVQGQGDIVIGNNVSVDGRCTFHFGTRFSATPTLEIGDNTRIGHDTDFTVGKRITVGNNCNISGATRILDSSGHPSDAAARRKNEPPTEDKVRPVTIGDDVWIAKNCVILPGVHIGDGAIVSAGSIVREDVRPYTIVSGNPAREVHTIRAPANGSHPPLPKANPTT